MAGTLAKLPLVFNALSAGTFAARNLGGIIAAALNIYFSTPRACPPLILAVLGTTFAGTLTFLDLLPVASDSQTLFLAFLQAPFFYWSLVGIVFLGANWRDAQSRMLYLR